VKDRTGVADRIAQQRTVPIQWVSASHASGSGQR
jgi:hypothetical protein